MYLDVEDYKTENKIHIDPDCRQGEKVAASVSASYRQPYSAADNK